MAKYKREVTEYVLDRVSIMDVVGHYVELKRAGRNLKGLCPFHGEKTPSFVVSDERQSYHCFGCGASGNAIGFVMQKENMGFLDALEYLADRYNVSLETFLEKDNLKREQDTKPMYEVMRQAALFFYKQLGKDQTAMHYFQNRGLSPSILKQFGLGYAPQGWDHLLKALRSQGVSEEMLVQCGLVVKKETGGYYDRFRHRVMFPIFDYRGRVVAFGGRVLDDSNPKYLNSAESRIFYKSQTLYGLNVARKFQDPMRRVIVVEGYMDTITLHQYGFNNAVATLGTAMTELHAKELKKLYDEVLFAYDADEAGQNAIARSLSVLKAQDLRVKIIDMLDCKDPDEFLKKYGSDAFKNQIEGAMNTIDFSLKRLEKGYNLKDDEQRLTFLKAAYAFIGDLSSLAERDVYLEKLAKHTDISFTALHEDFLKYIKAPGPGQTKAPAQAPAPKANKPVKAEHAEPTPGFDMGDDYLAAMSPDDLLDMMDMMPPDLFDEGDGPGEGLVERQAASPQATREQKSSRKISPQDLNSDDKLVTIEKAVLKCTLVSKAFFNRVAQRMTWDFYYAFNQRDYEAISQYYATHDAFDPVTAIELLALDLVERLKDVSVDSTQVSTPQDVDKLLGFHYKHLCEAKIKVIDTELAALKLKPGQEAQLLYREKMVERVKLSSELAKAMREMRA